MNKIERNFGNSHLLLPVIVSHSYNLMHRDITRDVIFGSDGDENFHVTLTPTHRLYDVIFP